MEKSLEDKGVRLCVLIARLAKNIDDFNGLAYATGDRRRGNRGAGNDVYPLFQFQLMGFSPGKLVLKPWPFDFFRLIAFPKRR